MSKERNIMRILCLLFIFFNLTLRAQIITTIAGDGFGGDGTPAINAELNDPCGMIIDKYGNIYFATNLGNQVREIDTNGIISTIAGTGTAGYSGDDSLAINAMLNQPVNLAFDTSGNIFIADAGNMRIRKIILNTGIITTIAGNGISGYSGDGGWATDASLSLPEGLCFDSLNNLYIADYANNRIRFVNTSGVISTFAGTGISGFYGNGIPATSAQLTPCDLRIDKFGNLYEDDWPNLRIRKIDVLGIITTVAGNDSGSYIYNGDGMPATNANMNPQFITIDDTGGLYISDYTNNRIRYVSSSGYISTIIGDGIAGNIGEGGLADSAEIYYPSGMVFDKCGNLIFGQVGNNIISKVTFDSTCDPYTTKVPPLPQNELVIYPNPAVNELHIEGIKYIQKYRLLNIKNNITQAGNLQMGSNTIDIRALPPGMYFLEMTDEKGYRTIKKVIKE